jgi:D-alanyl-lipoteichoic acid acyltransferase DltB (MBOAT superfamily)
MLFNSYTFILLYLPIAVAGFFVLAGRNPMFGATWLVAASLFFYAWWNPAYVLLLAASIVGNFFVGREISRAFTAGLRRRAKSLLAFGVGADLALLAYYKYANFFVNVANDLHAVDWHLAPILLPLGISFFTFTQIAFLVDSHRGEAREPNFVHYALFVTYFPHLIAGPILHHKEVMPQFGLAKTYRFDYQNVAVGLTIFFIGLFKKTVLADGISGYANPVFDAAAAGHTLTLLDSWGGALAYTLQLYFDFSGYSDMAIGLSCLFGIRLPLNFSSPYKATSIIEFWRRWHMTLSRFLRDYLYIPLGGNRKGPARRSANMAITMLLGGLWHGAGWTFIVWGALHGVCLLVNHWWRTLVGSGGRQRWWSTASAWLLAFTCVVVAWVFFRASDLSAALAMLEAMSGGNGVILPASWSHRLSALSDLGLAFGPVEYFMGWKQLAWTICLLGIALCCPNTQQIMRNFQPAIGAVPETAGILWRRIAWQPSLFWLLALVATSVSGLLMMRPASDFLYFQF